MNSAHALIDLIKQRISVRTYTPNPIEIKDIAKLDEFLASVPSGAFQSQLRFQLITAKPDDTDALRGLGTYGQIKHPAGFIIGAMKPGVKNLEDFGYVMEQIVLFATDLGLGTCWLGGSFQQSHFAKAIRCAEDEMVPATISIGHPADAISLRDRLIHLMIDTEKRFAWEQLFFQNSFQTPLIQTEAGSYATPLEMVRLAPSASNFQPWRIVNTVQDNLFHFYLTRKPGYNRSEKKYFKMADLQRIDMGIAMSHFELTAREQGLQGKWKIVEPNLAPLPAHTEYVATWSE